MTITGPSKSICVMSTWSGTTFLTTAFASSRMSSMLIVGSLGLRPATGRFRSTGVVGLCQLHRRFSLLDVRLGELGIALLRDRDAVGGPPRRPSPPPSRAARRRLRRVAPAQLPEASLGLTGGVGGGGGAGACLSSTKEGYTQF